MRHCGAFGALRRHDSHRPIRRCAQPKSCKARHVDAIRSNPSPHRIGCAPGRRQAAWPLLRSASAPLTSKDSGNDARGGATHESLSRHRAAVGLEVMGIVARVLRRLARFIRGCRPLVLRRRRLRMDAGASADGSRSGKVQPANVSAAIITKSARFMSSLPLGSTSARSRASPSPAPRQAPLAPSSRNCARRSHRPDL